MRHKSLNNFRAFHKGYPFAGNIPAEMLRQKKEGAEYSGELIITAAVDQIEEMLRPTPFEPENYGFKLNPNSTATYVGNGHVLVREENGYWELNGSIDSVYLPNDFIAKIVLTSLGVIERKDPKCPSDDNYDGICASCENFGCCIMEKQGQAAEPAPVEETPQVE